MMKVEVLGPPFLLEMLNFNPFAHFFKILFGDYNFIL